MIFMCYWKWSWLSDQTTEAPWRFEISSGQELLCGRYFMDLSNAFDCLPHEIINWLFMDCHSNVLQDSIMGSFLFNIFINDIVFTLLNMEHCTTMLMTIPYHMPSRLLYFNECFGKRKLCFNILILSNPTHIHFKL